VRDIDLLERIAKRSVLRVNMSVACIHTRLARMLEPRAPRPDLRLEAVSKLRAAGISAGVNAMPILPGLTDGEKDLDALVRAAKEANSEWIAGGVLFLMPSSLKQFLPFLGQKFPKLLRQYQEWFGRGGYAPETYRKEIADRFEKLRLKYGISGRPQMPTAAQQYSPQMVLSLTP